MLGHPALVAGHHRGDAQREALLAEQGVAAVAGAERPDLARLGVVDDVLVVRVARPRDVVAGRGSSGVPTECTQGTKSPSSPSTSSAPAPMRVMIRMRDGDVGRVGQLHADVRRSRSRAGPSRTARRTSCGRASSPRRARPGAAHLGRVAPVVGRAGVLLGLGADERAVLDAGDVARVGERQVASSGAWRRRGARTCPRRPAPAQRRSYSSAEPSHQWMRSGWVRVAISSTQATSFSCLVGGASVSVMLTCTPSVGSRGIRGSIPSLSELCFQNRRDPDRSTRSTRPDIPLRDEHQTFELGDQHAVLVEDPRVDLDDAAIGLAAGSS